MLYHNIKIILAIVFIGLQTISLTHNYEHAEEPHQDCIICDFGVMSTDGDDIMPPVIVEATSIVSEPIVYTIVYVSADTLQNPSRGPPPQGPPIFQA